MLICCCGGWCSDWVVSCWCVILIWEIWSRMGNFWCWCVWLVWLKKWCWNWFWLCCGSWNVVFVWGCLIFCFWLFFGFIWFVWLRVWCWLFGYCVGWCSVLCCFSCSWCWVVGYLVLVVVFWKWVGICFFGFVLVKF